MATINARLVIYHFVIPFPMSLEAAFLHLCVFVIFLDLREAEPSLALPRRASS